MNMYKDYTYVKYVYEDVPMEEAFDIYLKVLEQINENRLWDLFKLELEHNGFSGTFEQYKRNKQNTVKNNKMDEIEKDRIRNNVSDIRQNMNKSQGVRVSIANLK